MKAERPPIRVIGKSEDNVTNTDWKKRAEIDYQARFSKQELGAFSEGLREKIKEGELRKEGYETWAIKKANEITNGLIKRSNTSRFNVPPQNVHILDDGLFKDVVSESRIRNPERLKGMHSIDNQAAFVNKDACMSKVQEAVNIFHEITHLKGHLALRIHGEGKFVYRQGNGLARLRFKDEKNRISYLFDGLEEAVTESIVKKYFLSFIETCPDKKIKEELGHILRLRQYVKEHPGEVVPPSVEAEELSSIAPDGKAFGRFGYPSQRKVLNYLLQEIYTANSERFKNADEVMELFIESHFNGDMLKIGRMVEETFGEKSFALVGYMNDDGEIANEVLRTLKIFRECHLAEARGESIAEEKRNERDETVRELKEKI